MRFHSLVSALSVVILSAGLVHCGGASDDDEDDELTSESESDLTKDGGADAGKKKKPKKDAGTSKKDAGKQDASTGSSNKDAETDPEDSGAPVSGPTAPTWTEIYDNYFADGTPGHCGDCHANKGIAVGTTKTSFYNALVSSQLVDLTTPADSVLGLSPGSPLSWFGGSMPKDDPSPNPAAAKAITAWLQDGAKNN